MPYSGPARSSGVSNSSKLARMIGGLTESKFLDVAPRVCRQLRHTAAVNLAHAGRPVPEIASVTGHSLRTVTHSLKNHLPADSTIAGHAISKLERFRNPGA